MRSGRAPVIPKLVAKPKPTYHGGVTAGQERAQSAFESRRDTQAAPENDKWAAGGEPGKTLHTHILAPFMRPHTMFVALICPCVFPHLLRALFLGRERACVVHRRRFSPDPPSPSRHAPACHLLSSLLSLSSLLFLLLLFSLSLAFNTGTEAGRGLVMVVRGGILSVVRQKRRVETLAKLYLYMVYSSVEEIS